MSCGSILSSGGQLSEPSWRPILEGGRVVFERRILAKNNDGARSISDVKPGRVGLVVGWVATSKIYFKQIIFRHYRSSSLVLKHRKSAKCHTSILRAQPVKIQCLTARVEMVEFGEIFFQLAQPVTFSAITSHYWT